MLLSLFLVSMVFLFCCLAYGFYKTKSNALSIANQLDQTQVELKLRQKTEKEMQEKISILQNKLRHTFEDPITNLLGWQLFEDRLNQNIKESGRYQLTLAVLFIDIDDFKMINDGLSYEIGDLLLQEVAERLQLCIRQVDSMSRFTKDTFVALLTQLAKPETAAVVAQRMLQELAKPFNIKGNELYITACIGISIYPTDGQEPQALLRSADHALHLAKDKGKHLYQFYQENMHVQSQRELVFYSSLNRDSVFQEFVLYYQPIMNVQANTIACMDVLLHWQHPQLGLITPQELYIYAERQRKLNVITEWLFKNACRQFLHWRSLNFKPMMLGIPISIKQLENSHFIYRLSQILIELDFKPEWLLLEIKESFSPLSSQILEKAFNMLHYIGMNLAIEDFGSGNFSLVHLKSIPVHYLKLDSSLIADITENQQAVSLIKSVLVLAKNMSMQVIMQGIESEEQVTLLKGLGCDLMQGHHLSPALSDNEVVNNLTILTQ